MQNIDLIVPPREVRQESYEYISAMLKLMLQYAGKEGIDKWNALLLLIDVASQDLMRDAPEAGHEMICEMIGVRRDQLMMPPPGPSEEFNRKCNAGLKRTFCNWQAALRLGRQDTEGSA